MIRATVQVRPILGTTISDCDVVVLDMTNAAIRFEFSEPIANLVASQPVPRGRSGMPETY